MLSRKKFQLITVLPIFIIMFFSGQIYASDSSIAPPGYLPQKGIKTPFQRISEEGTPDILLIQTANPWNSNADITVLDALENSYKMVDMTDVPSINIDDYQVVLIVNDQVQSFYDNYANNYNKFESYVQNGGTLVFFACDHGWANGDNYTDLPGGIQVGDRYSYYNSISNTNHEIVTQELTNHPDAPLTNSDMDSNYCSHNYFIESTLPAGADIILRTYDSDEYPTLVVYPLGNGNVIASGLTWEHAYDRYAGPGVRYGFGRALPDVFKYAFSIAGGHKTAGVNVDIYPEDYWLAQRQEVYKAKEDLLDIVACITNNTNPNIEQTDVSLTLTIDNTKIDTGFLKVYKRASAEEIAITDPVELTQGTEYSITDNNGVREITINGLTIKTKSVQQWNDFVFRFKIANNVANGQTLDAEATVFGGNIKTVSEKLSDGGATVTVISEGKIVLTNRELMYKQFAKNDNGASQVNQLWESLYNIAAEQRAVVYHIDKCDRDNDGDAANNITIDWLDDRLHLKNGDDEGNYHYGDIPTSNDEPNNDANIANEEEVRVNQVSTKIKGLLNDFITRSGRTIGGKLKPCSSVDVVILGGDAIIPFYRVFDPSSYDFDDDGDGVIDITESTVLHYQEDHTASNVTEEDARNNYLFSDIFYRDFNGKGWGEGNVESIYVGRIAGTTARDLNTLLLSSNKETTSANVVKLENYQRDEELEDFHDECDDAGYNVVTTINSKNIDIDNPNAHDWNPFTNRFQVYKDANGNVMDDEAIPADFVAFFDGTASDAVNFDIMRFMSHGTVDGVRSSRSSSYFTGYNLNAKTAAIKTNLNKFHPFFIFDACLVGIVDGNNQDNLFNALFQKNIRGVIGASGVSWSNRSKKKDDISGFNDLFSDAFLSGKSAGKALCEADDKFGSPDDNDNLEDYTRFQMNLFGLPWATIHSPDDREAKANQILAVKQKPLTKDGVSLIQSDVLGTNTKSVTIDASNYTIETVGTYDIVEVDGFYLLHKQSKPVVPVKKIEINLPLNAYIDNVDVRFSNSNYLGATNIPAYQLPPPMPGSKWEGGYIDCPDNLGVFPSEQYTYRISEVTEYKTVQVFIYPLTYDTSNKETTLYQGIEVSVTYTTPDQGLVSNFTLDKRTYAVGENIQTTTTIENISASADSFTVTVDVLDLTDKVISTNSTSQSIASNTADAIIVNLTAPATAGPFRLSMTASDGTNTIGSSQQEINVVEGRIVSFTAPTSIDSGSYGSFIIEFENLSQAEITAYEDIYIYDSSSAQVAHLPQIAEVIGTGMTETSTAQWFPPVSLPSGTYSSYVAVKVNNNVFTMKSNTFDIIDPNDILLSQGWNLISLNLLSADTAIDSVLSGISGKYSAVWAYINGSWQVYDPFNPGFSDLSTMEPGYGYWLNMTEAATLTVTGIEPSKSIDLISGWNMVGYNSSIAQAIADALASIAGKYISAWAFINGSWQVYDPANPGLSDLTTMEPGYGYWINTTEACTWTLP